MKGGIGWNPYREGINEISSRGRVALIASDLTVTVPDERRARDFAFELIEMGYSVNLMSRTYFVALKGKEGEQKISCRVVSDDA